MIDDDDYDDAVYRPNNNSDITLLINGAVVECKNARHC